MQREQAMKSETMKSDAKNPTGMTGIAFVEYAAPTREGEERLARLFASLGFSMLRRHRDRAIDAWTQNECRFYVNREAGSFAADFAKRHGPSIPALGIWVDDPEHALDVAVSRGATRWGGETPYAAPAIVGIGGSLVVFVRRGAHEELFLELDAPVRVPERGFLCVDHLTNNVEKGTMERWRSFYRDVFGFTDVRSFEIRGKATGLTSYALRSPCGSFCIPINEGDESKSQIEEYLREYRGAGIQHIALLTRDLLRSVDGLGAAGVQTLDIDPEYYASVFERVPGVHEDHAAIEKEKILVDGDEEGYLLQIFTGNVIGPIFFELIQRENHLSFGEGNFGALFRSIERDQERRGVL